MAVDRGPPESNSMKKPTDVESAIRRGQRGNGGIGRELFDGFVASCYWIAMNNDYLPIDIDDPVLSDTCLSVHLQFLASIACERGLRNFHHQQDVSGMRVGRPIVVRLSPHQSHVRLWF